MSAFKAVDYDGNIRKVIPFYDDIYDRIFGVIEAYCGEKPLALLDTGCGTGSLGARAVKELKLSRLVLCDPSEKMLEDAKIKLQGQQCEFVLAGSEQLDLENSFDVVTAIQSHHYFDRKTRQTAVANCFRALKKGGLFICFENTAPNTSTGKNIMLTQLEKFEFAAGRTAEDIKAHSARYNTEFFPITITDHFELLKNTGFEVTELFWHTYMQSGFYAIK